MCEKVYVIEDENAACSSALLSLLRGYALSGGHDIIASPCPLDPSGEPEHLLIPALSLGFVTSNRLHEAELDGAVKINCARFTDRAALRRRLPRLNFTKEGLRRVYRRGGGLAQERKGNSRQIGEHIYLRHGLLAHG